METLPHSRAEDLPPEGRRGGAVDPSPLVGTWLNTDRFSPGIVRVVLATTATTATADIGLTVHAFGAGSPEPIDWGTVPAQVYADGVASTAPAGFSAGYDFGFLRVSLQGKMNRGVLVLALFNEFRDQSGRASWFNREFYYHGL